MYRYYIYTNIDIINVLSKKCKRKIMISHIFLSDETK